MRNSKLIFWILIFAAALFFAYKVKEILSPFIASLIIAYLLDPFTNRLEQLGVKRTYTVSIIVIVFFIFITSIFIKLIPSMFDQLKQFIATLPKYEAYLNKVALSKFELSLTKIDAKLASEIHNHLSNIASKALNYFVFSISKMFSSSIAVFTMLAFILFTPILVFYVLRDWPFFTKKLLSLMPKSSKNIILEQLKHIDEVLSSCIRGQLTVCFIMAFYYSIALSFLELNYSLLLGIIAGFCTIIPFVGFFFALSLSLLVALLQFSESTSIYLTLGAFIVGNIMESYFITPKLVGEKIGLHPVWIIFALMAGGCLFGLWGMFFALPTAAIISVVFKSMVKIYLQSNFYENKNG